MIWFNILKWEKPAWMRYHNKINIFKNQTMHVFTVASAKSTANIKTAKSKLILH